MIGLLLYSLKVAACIAVFHLFYKLLMSRDTWHRLNRVVLLVGVVGSFVLPLCVITHYLEMPAVPELSQVETARSAGTELAVAATSGFDWWLLGAVLFGVGALGVCGRWLLSLWGVMRLVHSGRQERLSNGVVLVHIQRKVVPFSWLRYIVISENEQDTQAILIHERAHLQLRHSCDLLLFDLLTTVQWFNPAIWLLRRELCAVHEYEADAAVVASGVELREYQLLLIKKAVGGRWYSVANSLNHSKLKNRITMMLQKRSSRWVGAKSLLLLPLSALALSAFAETVVLYPEDKGKKEKQIIVISDTDSASIRVTTDNEQLASDITKRLRGKVKSVTIRSDSQVEVDGVSYPTDSLLKSDSYQIHTVTTHRDSTASGKGKGQKTIVISTKNGYGKQGASSSVSVSGKPEKGKTQVLSTITTTTTDNESAKQGHLTVVLDDSDSLKSSVSLTCSPNEETPVVVINGKKSSMKKLKNLSAMDIESITVSKDAADVAHYGKAAANGVIVVTTKK